MSESVDELKQESRVILCKLLRIPESSDNKDVDLFIEKILLCATLEAMNLVKVLGYDSGLLRYREYWVMERLKENGKPNQKTKQR